MNPLLLVGYLIWISSLYHIFYLMKIHMELNSLRTEYTNKSKLEEYWLRRKNGNPRHLNSFNSPSCEE